MVNFLRPYTFFNYENLIIRCSKSGKLNKRLVRDFFQNVFKPIVEQNPEKKTVLVVDSWSAQKSDELYQDKNAAVLLKILPEDSTGFMPLDLFCFHQAFHGTRFSYRKSNTFAQARKYIENP